MFPHKGSSVLRFVALVPLKVSARSNKQHQTLKKVARKFSIAAPLWTTQAVVTAGEV
jgi:hypothetical protein